MNVYRIYLFIDLFDFTSLLIFVSNKERENIVLFFTLTPLLMIDKKGEKYFSIYACFGKRIYVHAYCFVLQMGEKEFDVFYACLSPCICMHVYKLSLHIYLFIVMHELRGSFFEALL